MKKVLKIALHKTTRHRAEVISGYYTPSEFLAIVKHLSNGVKLDTYFISVIYYQTEKKASGRSNPSWIYIPVKRKVAELFEQDKYYR